MDARRSDATHVLLTRFNVALNDSRAAPTEDWLRDRLDLFTRFTLPSMLAQTVPPDSWLILCDDASPAWFRERLDDVLPAWAQTVWFEGPLDKGRLSREVARRAGGGPVITTRLDNDDCVARDFIATIQEHSAARDRYFVNFTVGAQYQSGRFYHRLDPSNAFISLVEPASDEPPRTVFLDTHNRLNRHGRIVQVHTHPMWLQMVHGRNVANVVRGVRVGPGRVVPHFDVPLEQDPSGYVALALDKLTTTLGLAGRVVRSRRRVTWLLRSLGARHP